MAQFGAPFMGVNPFNPTSPENLFSTPFASTIEDEDPDEWEYEYSATETETFFLTLDLTTPEVEPKRKGLLDDDCVRTRWVNQNLGRNSRNRKAKPATYSTVTGRTEEDDMLGEVEAEEEELDEEPFPKERSAPQGDGIMPEEIQIVDLHSSNPMVSYDGHIYSCQWASNVGTELLFTAHDRDSTIPKLRSLPGGVDLLAASSARLISNFVEVKAKSRESSPEHTYRRGSQLCRRGSQINMDDQSITVGPWVGSRRKDQAIFLEQLMAIKEEKGETDEVTVIALKRNSNPEWRREIRQKRATERRRLEGIIKKKAKSAPNGREVRDARKRLEELNAEEEKQTRGDVAKGKHPEGRKRKPKDPKAKKGKKQKVFLPRKRNRRDGNFGQTRPDTGEEYGIPEFESLAAYSPENGQMVYGEGGYGEMDDGDDCYDEDAPGEYDDAAFG